MDFHIGKRVRRKIVHFWKVFSFVTVCFCVVSIRYSVQRNTLYGLDSHNSVTGGPTKLVNIQLNTRVTENITMKTRFENCRLYPDVLIVGFEKCGTLTLRSFLGAHPQIFITDSNLNIPYFNSVNYVSFEEFTQDKPCTPTGKLRLEKIATNGSAGNVYQTLPNLKLLVIIREPVERAMSHHIHRLARKKEKTIRFDNEIKSLLDGDKQNSSILFQQSTYIDRLQQWLQTYGRNKMHVIDGDNFSRNPAVELNNVEKFLDIAPYFTEAHFVFDPAKKFYCLKRTTTDTPYCMNKGKGRPHPTMSVETRQRLQDYFRPYNEKLFQALGKKFLWNY